MHALLDDLKKQKLRYLLTSAAVDSKLASSTHLKLAGRGLYVAATGVRAFPPLEACPEGKGCGLSAHVTGTLIFVVLVSSPVNVKRLADVF